MMGPTVTRCEGCHREYDYSHLKSYDGYHSPSICAECHMDEVMEFMEGHSLKKLKSIFVLSRLVVSPSLFHRSRLDNLKVALDYFDKEAAK
jgi:hypothetical protein